MLSTLHALDILSANTLFTKYNYNNEFNRRQTKNYVLQISAQRNRISTAGFKFKCKTSKRQQTEPLSLPIMFKNFNVRVTVKQV